MRSLVSILLVAAGLAIAAWVVMGAKGLTMVGPADEWIAGALLLGSGAIIGGGVVTPFRRAWLTLLGVLIGLVAMGALLVVIVVISSALNWR